MATSKTKPAPARQAMIYATGTDSELRILCYTLLQEGLVTKANLIDCASFILEDDGVADLRWGGRAITLICPRPKLKKVLRRMKKAYVGDDLEAYALPVLAKL